jgi:hypothetical protein
MQQHIGTKLINAEPMNRQAYNDLRGWTIPADENPADEGYLVEYIDGGQANHPDFKGYISWSPKDVFERAYRPVTGMSFGLALEAMKQEHYVQRTGWNGKGLKLALVGKGGCYMHSFAEVSTLPYIVIIYPQNAQNTPGAIVPWLASQTDMLADDWQIVE